MTSADDGWRTLLAATFAIGISNSVVFAVLSDLQDRYGFADAGLGLIAGTGFLVGFATQLLIAPIADRGHARALIVAGLAAAVGGSLLFAGGSSLATFVAARSVVGLSAGLFIPAARAIAASAPDVGSGAAARLGRLGSIELAGLILGPVIGGALVDPLGVRWPFLVCGTAAALALAALGARPLPSPPTAVGRTRLSIALLRVPAMQVAVLVALALYLPVGVYDALWDRYLTDRGAPNAWIGLSFVIYGLPFVVLAARGGRLADRVGPARAAIAGAMLVGPFTAVYGLLSEPAAIIGASAAEGVVHAVASPAAFAAVAGAAPFGAATAAQGLAGAAQLAGAAAAAFVMPTVYGAWGGAAVFCLTGGAVVACALTAALIRTR